MDHIRMSTTGVTDLDNVRKLWHPDIAFTQTNGLLVKNISRENSKTCSNNYEDIVQQHGMKERHRNKKKQYLNSRRYVQSAPVSLQNLCQTRLIYLKSDDSTSKNGLNKTRTAVPRRCAEQRKSAAAPRSGYQRPWTTLSKQCYQQGSSACFRSNLTSAMSTRKPSSHIIPACLCMRDQSILRVDVYLPKGNNAGWLASPANNEDAFKCVCGKDISKYHLLEQRKSQKSKSRGFRRRNVYSKGNIEHTDSEINSGQLAHNKLSTDLLARFRQGVVTVISVQRLMKAMKQLSDSMTSRSATEERWQALYGNARAQDLVFNRAAFAKDKAYNKMPVWALSLMETVPEERTNEDLNKLHALLRNMKSFDKFTQKIQLSMCRAFRYQSVESGRIVLRKGHVGQNFYFIHSGSVFVNVDDVNINGEPFVKTEVVLTTGDSFGELALLQDIRRTATISVRETCELLVVDKDTFARVCPKLFEKELEEKHAFLSHLELFSQRIWSKESMQNLCLEAQIQEYKTNRVIVADSTEEEWIYICMEGKCQVIRRLRIDNGTPKRKTESQLNSNTTAVVSDESFAVMNDFSQETTSKDADNILDPINTQQGKERLLHSMGLEYVRSRKLSLDDIRNLLQKQLQKQLPLDDKSKELESNSVFYGPLTLTSLIAQAEKAIVGKKLVHLIVKIMGGKDIFALQSIFDDGQTYTAPTNSNNSFILVSCGVRVLRIKKSSFLKYACPAAITHAKALAAKQRYPCDAVLYNSYHNHICWNKYKQELLRRVVVHSAKDESNLVASKRSMPHNLATRDDRTDQKLIEEVNLSTKCVIPEMKETEKANSKALINCNKISAKPFLPPALYRVKGTHSQVQAAQEFKTIEEVEELINYNPTLDRNKLL